VGLYTYSANGRAQLKSCLCWQCCIAQGALRRRSQRTTAITPGHPGGGKNFFWGSKALSYSGSRSRVPRLTIEPGITQRAAVRRASGYFLLRPSLWSRRYRRGQFDLCCQHVAFNPPHWRESRYCAPMGGDLAWKMSVRSRGRWRYRVRYAPLKGSRDSDRSGARRLNDYSGALVAAALTPKGRYRLARGRGVRVKESDRIRGSWLDGLQQLGIKPNPPMTVHYRGLPDPRSGQVDQPR